MSRPCGCGDRGRHRKDCKGVSAPISDDAFIPIGGEEEYVEWVRPVLAWHPNKKRQKGIEKRIRSLLRRHRSFYLDTINFDSEPETWFVDSWAWVSRIDSDTGKYSITLDHLNNCLEFLGGGKRLWENKKRSTGRRRRIKRGLAL